MTGRTAVNIKYFVPGPTELCERVLKATSTQVISHRSSKFREIFNEVRDLLAGVYATDSGNIAILTGSGTLAVNSMIYGIMKPGERALVISHGEFGERIVRALQARGCLVDVLRSKEGDVVDLNEVREALGKTSYRAIFTTHTETSTGVTTRYLPEIAEEAKANGALICVDAVSSLAGEPLKMDDWGLDAVSSCSQKCIGAPPGLSFVAMSDEALKSLRSDGVPPYLDLQKYFEYSKDGETPFTPAVNIIYGLLEALRILVLEEGVEGRISRLGEVSEKLYSGAESLGLTPLARRDVRSRTVVALKLPENIQASRVIKEMREECGIVIARGMGNLREKIVRVGVMGYITSKDADAILEGLEIALRRVGGA
ncbi:MAG: alanine--glyoxylate aminotransferase family protein [Nitrososphaeria archaeon]|nr:alanine--glyoxylate aminotransferase family protein [Nitrososphaeria archaeon]